MPIFGILIAQEVLMRAKGLQEAERDTLRGHPYDAYIIQKDANLAIKLGCDRFPGENGGDSQHNDRGDAVKHCYLSALLTKHLGVERGKAFMDAHEERENNPPLEKQMDLFNNEFGRNLVLGNPYATEEQLAEMCVEAVKNGLTKVLAGPGKNM